MCDTNTRSMKVTCVPDKLPMSVPAATGRGVTKRSSSSSTTCSFARKWAKASTQLNDVRATTWRIGEHSHARFGSGKRYDGAAQCMQERWLDRPALRHVRRRLPAAS